LSKFEPERRRVRNIAKELVIRVWHSPWLDLLPGYCISLLAHVVALLLLAMLVITLRPAIRQAPPVEMTETDTTEPLPEPLDSLQVSTSSIDKTSTTAGLSTASSDAAAIASSALPPLDPKTRALDLSDDFAAIAGPSSPRFSGELAGRSGAARTKLVTQGGGSSASERSVSGGLKWLAKYQQPDGKWSFHHGFDDPGTLDKCYTGATGLAVLAFLGAGHTHKSEQAKYRSAVEKGLHYLVSQVKRQGTLGDLRGKVVSNEGMYAHAIATLALCEAYGQTRDSDLKNAAQWTVNFIVAAQEQKGGGWRYSPGQPGDTTVTGWQLMALKSARNGRLKFPARTLVNANHFLDSMQTHDGSRYGYDARGESPPMTAIGLLCRMYLGWTHENAALQNGVEFLSKTGPSPNDIYYDYYATQVLHHWGGDEWKKWNEVLRDQLIETQVKRGDAAGSWKPTGDRGAPAGGRLYQTCLSVMTLEVYYRYLPLYQQDEKETAAQKR
jgi:hypothetical protein